MLNAQFVPARLTVPAGTNIIWTNKEGDVHTVTGYDGLFDSGPLSFGQTFSYNFTVPGTFNYYCKPHVDMIATILVQ